MTQKATTVLTSIVEKVETETGYTVTSFNASGEPNAAAIVNAVIDAYPRPDLSDLGLDGLSLDDWAAAKTQVTLVMSGGTMFGASLVAVEEVTLFAGSGGVAYKSKGARTNGFRLRRENVLDVIVGWRKAEAIKRVLDVRAQFPELVALTTERLAQLPTERTDSCSLAVFGTWPGLGEGRESQAVWLLSDYDPEDDIANGVLLVRDQFGVSEHGSAYGKDLLRFGGEVVGFSPVPFGDAIDLTSSDDQAVVLALLLPEPASV